MEKDINPQWIVIGSNSYHQIQGYGTSEGKPFRSEQAATKTMRRLEKRYKSLDWFTLPITAVPEGEL